MMQMAYTMGAGQGDTDLLLYGVVQDLIGEGLRPCGTVQINTCSDDGRPCDMDVQVLPDGPVVRISQSLGAKAKGCRLDPGALEVAVGEALARMAEGSQFLVVNKFGKHEAEGRGFRDVISEAVARDLPVLVGLNRLNQQPFHDFSAGTAAALPPDAEAIKAWVRAAVSQSR